MIQIHNSLSKQKEKFNPLQDGDVGIYSCGPTVYDRAHIGNMAAFILADSLRRMFAISGFDTKHVMNFTDVDDKTIAASAKKYPDLDSLEALQKLTRENEKLFQEDIAKIGIAVDEIEFIRATESIELMQELITKLHSKDLAYIADDGVYFNLEKYRERHTYGVLAHIDESSTSKSRINNDEYDKTSVHDFALWKLQQEGEPAWDFELDGNNLPGRPGWHIECSAMSTHTLGQPFDVHTGGIDLQFPHHENEIAQSTGAGDTKFSNYFLHNEHLLVDGKKMAKSLQNFHTIEDIVSNGHDPMAFRMLVLQSHYRHQLNFSFGSLTSATNFLRRVHAFADLRFQTSDEGAQITVQQTQETILERLQDDLDTPAAIAALAELIDNARSPISSESKDEFEQFIVWLDSAFGFDLSSCTDITKEQKQLISERENARQQKDFAKADQLRESLAKEGIEIDDTTSGPIWSRN